MFILWILVFMMLYSITKSFIQISYRSHKKNNTPEAKAFRKHWLEEHPNRDKSPSLFLDMFTK